MIPNCLSGVCNVVIGRGKLGLHREERFDVCVLGGGRKVRGVELVHREGEMADVVEEEVVLRGKRGVGAR